MFEALKKYAVFTGRARRREYWLFILLFMILYIAAIAIDIGLGSFSPETGFGAASVIVFVLFFIPSISAQVRRLHDTNRSGWWILLSFLPLVGPIVLLVFYCMNGTKGDNKYGPDPKALESAVEVF